MPPLRDRATNAESCTRASQRARLRLFVDDEAAPCRVRTPLRSSGLPALFPAGKAPGAAELRAAQVEVVAHYVYGKGVSLSASMRRTLPLTLNG